MSVTEQTWRQTVMPLGATIKEAVANLNDTGLQIILVLDDQEHLIGTVTDGDIRRGLLRGLQLSDPVSEIMRQNALVVPPEMSREMVLHLMRANKLRQLPVVDTQHRVVGLNLWDETDEVHQRPNLMVVMAGGLGRRLRPYTESCPKPMLEVAGKPMLQHIIERARDHGFRNFVLAVQYLGHVIEEYFGNGERFQVNIEYLRETSPLGTAGALGLLNPKPEIPMVVTNGDVLSDIHYGELLDFHVRHQAAATMAVRVHEWQHPFGVVQTNGVDIVGFEEKPIARTHINAGIYVLSPDVVNSIARDVRLDMPTLFEQLQAKGSRTVAYPMHEPWLDVGQPDDLVRANYEKNNS